ncbi:MAG: hypothetical protein AMJ60_08440, partial [Desulfobacterales bacterium SG8_35]
TEVKLLSADGTAWATGWESRSPPNSFYRKSPIPKGVGDFFVLPPHPLRPAAQKIYVSNSPPGVFQNTILP